MNDATPLDALVDDAELKEMISRYAEREHRSIGEQIHILLEEALERRGRLTRPESRPWLCGCGEEHSGAVVTCPKIETSTEHSTRLAQSERRNRR